jgi:ribosomal protein S18 acetylase RimI-like enzyme
VASAELSAELEQSRDLIAASVQAQAAQVGVWQEHGGMGWWLSGLPAMAANLVVACDPGASDRQIGALARWMARRPAPAGWLLWPDQQPARQQRLLEGCGFRPCERLWLASVACRHGDLEPGLWSPSTHEVEPGSSRQLIAADRAAYGSLLQACHGIPASLAAVVAQAFVSERFSPMGQASVRLQTLAFDRRGALLAAITAAVVSRPAAPPLGGLLWLGTHPSCRRHGLGRLVTAAACRWLAGCGVARIHVQASDAAVTLYRSLGFAEDGWLELWGCPPFRP